VARMGEKRNVYRLLVGKPEGKRLVRRLRCMWVDNIKLESCGDRMWWRGLDWLWIGTSRELLLTW
jgi:hypothetical protein